MKFTVPKACNCYVRSHQTFFNEFTCLFLLIIKLSIYIYNYVYFPKRKMMKFYSMLVLKLWITQGFCNEYGKTRSLSGSDYGFEYNLNHTRRRENSDSSEKVAYRPLFNWDSNHESEAFSHKQFLNSNAIMMSNDVNSDQRNSSNIWWPWSNYEEWALAHTHNGFNANELRRMKPSLKHFVKPLDNKVTADKFDHIKMTLWGSTERAMTKPIEEKKHRRKGKKRKNRKKKKNNNDNNQFPISNQIPINEPSNTSYKGHSNSDNNEMDNEIRPSYNYYNSVPVVDSRKSQRNTLKRNQHLNIFLTTYLKRNFTEDVNECLTDNGGCEGLCINTPGSYKCHCTGGFRTDGNKCIDVNECLLRNGHGPCQDKCINLWGNYKCSCESIPGTRLSQDNHTCEDIDECKEQTAGCSHECINTVGSAFCLCPKGFMLGEDWKTCHDIDECTLEEMLEAPCEHHCQNTIGSYLCVN